MPDLNQWQEYLKSSGCRTLGEILSLRATKSKNSVESIWIDKAVEARKNEIAEEIMKNLCREGLSIQSAIGVLERVYEKMLGTKINL